MLTDKLGTFTGSTGQSITSSAASTDYIDLGATGTPPGGHTTAIPRDVGIGNPVKINIRVMETFATLTSLKVAVQVDNDSAFGSATTVLETEAIAAATLIAGYQFNINVLPPKTNERYLRLYFTVAGSSATAGKIFAATVMANEYPHTGLS